MTTTSLASYVLPLYSREPLTSDSFQGYLTGLSKTLEVIVVDDSPDEVFLAHDHSWGRDVRHIKPDERFDFAYRKVTNVITGVVAASGEKVSVADDDVRYGDAEIEEMLRRLDSADLVVPQNYFDPLPWHARWDAARSLLNRAVWIDFPGTLGLRRTGFVEMGGYDGDLLFENLELIRTVAASGGRVDEAVDLYVRRSPPPARHFWSQRV
ncbi:MAG: glycosyltransferase, partial [Actinomycetota bacterium]|nr:glycosyltransferase [Actinomycetota bacterium]